MSENLYEISKDVALIIQEIVDADGVLSTELEERFNKSSGDLKHKSTNIGKWCKNIKIYLKDIDTEIKRLQKRKKSQENLKERLEKYMIFCLQNADLNKLETSTLTFTIAKNPPSKDTENLTKDLESGEKIPGASLVLEQKWVLEIQDESLLPEKYLIRDKIHLLIY